MPGEYLDNSIVSIDTQLQYHLCLPDPDALSDWEWATKYAILLEILKQEREK